MEHEGDGKYCKHCRPSGSDGDAYCPGLVWLERDFGYHFDKNIVDLIGVDSKVGEDERGIERITSDELDVYGLCQDSSIKALKYGRSHVPSIPADTVFGSGKSLIGLLPFRSQV